MTLLLASALTACLTTAPAPTAGLTWICVDGGWRPTAPVAAPAPAPPATTGGKVAFIVGHTYEHTASGRQIHVAGLVQTASGVNALVLECVNALGTCVRVGELQPAPANVSASGWIEVR